MVGSHVQRKVRGWFVAWGACAAVWAMTGDVALAEPAQEAAAAEGEAPDGFVPLFNGSDLSGWKGLVGNPIKRAAMTADQLAAAQATSDAEIAKHWRAEDHQIVNDGHGPHLCTAKDYGDFELWLDWKIAAGADSGIYLRGAPQVQIWDPVNGIDQAKVGSGGLYNNQKNPSKPPVVADNPAGEWNTFYVRMVGERVWVTLNGKVVVDDVIMENYWDRSRPLDAKGQIELQTHGGEVRFRNLFIREIPADEANELLAKADDSFTPLFNGSDLAGWMGATDGYDVVDGAIRCRPGHGGNLLTEEEYADFVLRFEFKLKPGSNNGLAIRTPPKGDAAYVGMELQVLENTHPKFAGLKPHQYHGSVYGVKAAHRGFQRPVGTWNYQEVMCHGSLVKVTLNGTVILDADLSKLRPTIDGREHPGLDRSSGHLGFCGHNDPVEFRNIRLRAIGEH